MGWFKKKLRPQVRIVGTVIRNSSGVIVSESTGPVAPMSDERYAEIMREIDESKAQRAEFERQGQFRGKHFLDWTPELDRLRSEKRDDESLALLHEILPVSERAYRAWGHNPPGLLDTRIAIILRRRKDYVGEIAILEDFLRRNPEYAGEKITDRLTQARKLASKSSASSG